MIGAASAFASASVAIFAGASPAIAPEPAAPGRYQLGTSSGAPGVLESVDLVPARDHDGTSATPVLPEVAPPEPEPTPIRWMGQNNPAVVPFPKELTRLPWISFPRSADVIGAILETVDGALEEPDLSEPVRKFWTTLEAHLVAIAQRAPAAP